MLKDGKGGGGGGSKKGKFSYLKLYLNPSLNVRGKKVSLKEPCFP